VLPPLVEDLAGEDCGSVAPLLRRGETPGRPIGDDGLGL